MPCLFSSLSPASALPLAVLAPGAHVEAVTIGCLARADVPQGVAVPAQGSEETMASIEFQMVFGAISALSLLHVGSGDALVECRSTICTHVVVGQIEVLQTVTR